MELPCNKVTVSAETRSDLLQEPLGLPRPWPLRLGAAMAHTSLSLPHQLHKPAASLTTVKQPCCSPPKNSRNSQFKRAAEISLKGALLVRYKTPLTMQQLQAKTQNCQASSPIRRPPPPSSCLPEHQGLRQGTRAVRSWLAPHLSTCGENMGKKQRQTSGVKSEKGLVKNMFTRVYLA